MPKKKDILEQIDAAGLVGRGGASYPTAEKWAAVKSALKNRKAGYIIINGAEGEPGVKKDGYIIRHYAEQVLDGVCLADRFLGPDKVKKVYLFLNQEYFRAYGPRIKEILKQKKYAALAKKLEFFIKPERLAYVSGEETALLNLIEGKKAEPRLKPPYPTAYGLHGRPTLINNIETFYDVSLLSRNQFKNERFYTLDGAVKHRGVFPLPADLSIEEILRQTGNYPDFPFFVQIGGEASGEILNSEQLSAGVEGTGSIMVYDRKKTDEDKLTKYWLKFYHQQSCGQCTTCREGTYRLWEMAGQKSYDHKLFWDLVEVLDETSFCALGRSLPVPLRSYLQNIKHRN